MASYKPIYVRAYETGLVQERQEFILPEDAFPRLQNAYIWREKIVRKNGCQFVGRLQRNLVNLVLPSFSSAGPSTVPHPIFSLAGLSATQPNASFVIPSAANPITITMAAPISQTLTDVSGTGTMTVAPAGVITAATINYATGVISITFSGAVGASATTGTFSYYPNLPVMGDLTFEQNSDVLQKYIFFDQVYAYEFDDVTEQFAEFIPGTTWSGSDTNFFWPMNYWQSGNSVVGPNLKNSKLFWVTNFSGVSGDPIRYTEGISWVDFAPTIDNAGNKLHQCLAFLPFRGRMVAFRTLEGATLGSSVEQFQRIRWAAIGNPISDASVLMPLADISANAWNSDIRGKGGFLDIPTNQAITAVGFVRDNLVIYCTRSTWQLRYTGNSIAPFQIERVNAELGTESPFSAIQFDTSLVSIGDKGIIECDSFKARRIDVKIPDLAFNIQNVENGPERVYGVRDFENRLAYWTFPLNDGDGSDIYPNQRLVYNYENDSWALFDDSFTCFGNFQVTTDLIWQNADMTWQQADFPWVGQPTEFPYIAAGNQQGFVVLPDQLTVNQQTLFVQNLVGNVTTATVVTSPFHNLITGQVIQLTNLIGDWSDLEGSIFSIVLIDDNNFSLWTYNSATDAFDIPSTHAASTYIGGTVITVLDNFSIKSKKFNSLDTGEAVQFGMMDVLLETTDAGAIQCKIYENYSDQTPVNTYPENVNDTTGESDLFFNQIIPTTTPGTSTKQWQRFYCPVRAPFLTIEFTLSNAQMIGDEQQSEVIIHSQIIWMRPAGQLLTYGALT